MIIQCLLFRNQIRFSSSARIGAASSAVPLTLLSPPPPRPYPHTHPPTVTPTSHPNNQNHTDSASSRPDYEQIVPRILNQTILSSSVKKPSPMLRSRVKMMPRSIYMRGSGRLCERGIILTIARKVLRTLTRRSAQFRQGRESRFIKQCPTVWVARSSLTAGLIRTFAEFIGGEGSWK